jgi:hypothetical protein
MGRAETPLNLGAQCRSVGRSERLTSVYHHPHPTPHIKIAAFLAEQWDNGHNVAYH